MKALHSALSRLHHALAPGAAAAEKNTRFLRNMHREIDATVPAGATVFLGDSHTYGLVLSNVTSNAAKFATGGQTSAELLEEIPGLACLSRAACVVVTIGTNDLLQGRGTGMESRYREIIAAIPAPVALCSIPPIVHLARECIAAAGAAAAAATGRCRFVDLHGALTHAGEPLAGVLWDGVHLSAQGYAVWTELLRKALGPPA
jgi:lysophospholipase L1-like esterase